eukprot:113734_1
MVLAQLDQIILMQDLQMHVVFQVHQFHQINLLVQMLVKIITAPFTVQLDANGVGSVTSDNIDGGSTDVCGIANLSVSPNQFSCQDVGENMVTLTVTDNNGEVL